MKEAKGEVLPNAAMEISRLTPWADRTGGRARVILQAIPLEVWLWSKAGVGSEDLAAREPSPVTL